MDRNKFTPDNDSAGKMNQGRIIGGFFLKKALLTYMAINGIKGKHNSSIIPCYEHEYVDGDGTQLMDVYIAVE